MNRSACPDFTNSSPNRRDLLRIGRAGMLGLSLAQVLRAQSTKHKAAITRWEAKVLPRRVHVARGLSGTSSHGHVGGSAVSIGNDIGPGFVEPRVHVDACHPGRRDLEPLELHGTGWCGPDEAGHLVIVHPFADDRALYSHKAMMPFAGTLRIGSDDVGFAHGRGFLILDDHHGDYPRPMRYDWLTAARRAPEGRIEGFNLTRNQVRDPDVNNENALWWGPAVHRLPAVGRHVVDADHRADRYDEDAAARIRVQAFMNPEDRTAPPIPDLLVQDAHGARVLRVA